MPNPYFLAYLTSSREKVKYILYSQKNNLRYYQIMTITTIPSVESMVKSILGEVIHLSVK